MGWVHKHPYSVLEHCICVLLLLSPYVYGIKFITLLWQAHKQHDFGSEIMNNQISHLKLLQRTTPDELGAQTQTST